MYLPKSKYKTNLTATPGALKIKATEEPYIGPYFETFTGELYTGTFPSKASKQLVRNAFGISENFAINGEEIIGVPNEYDFVRSNNLEVQLKATLPIPVHYPKPAPADYGKKFITRYFAIEKSSGRILEISKEVYTSLNSKEPKYYYPKYDTKAIQWSLVNVRANQDTLQVSELSSYLKDPSQFVR